MTDVSKPAVEVISDDPSWNARGISAAQIDRALDALWARLANDGEEVALTVLLTNDGHMRTLNARFRDKDRATNVLSFPSGDEDYIGDIALGVETVTRESLEQHVHLADHVAHLVIHGALHLLGYDHKNDEEAEEMEQIEVSVLKDLGIDDPYTQDCLEKQKRPSCTEAAGS